MPKHRPKPPTPQIPEKQKRRMQREEFFTRVMTRSPMEGGDITETPEGEYTIHLGWQTLERLYDIAETRDVKAAVLIREAVAFWLEHLPIDYWEVPKPPTTTDHQYTSNATGQTVIVKNVPLSQHLPEVGEVLSIATAKHLETLINTALKSGLSIVETDFAATTQNYPPNALEPQSTLSRMLEESEAAAHALLRGIATVRQTGNDDKAILFDAVSLTHQKAKSLLRQLEKEAEAADQAEDSKPKRKK